MAEEFGPYLLEEVIGRGGMGVVYRAYDTRRDRTVALKRLPRELATDEHFQARFRRESRLAARLNEPHIIPIHDFGEHDGQLYIDMRLVEGVDLSKLITDEGGALSVELAVDIIAQVSAALASAHTAGLMHRDIKPSNVLISGMTAEDRTSPFAYLVDFGIARAIGNEGTALTSTTDWFGTVAYMAPERISGSSGDSRSDIYSLACLLYQCLTGQAPFTGEALQVLFAHVNNAPPSTSEKAREIPPGLDAAIRRGMAKKPDERYQTVSQFASAVKSSARTGTTMPPVSPQHGGPPAPQGQRSGPPYTAGTYAGPAQSVPPQSGPPQAGPPQSFPPRTGPPQSIPPQAGPHQSFPPRSGPPQSVPPRSGPPQSIPPQAGPQQSIPPRSGPPQSVPPRSGLPQSIPPPSGPHQSTPPRQQNTGTSGSFPGASYSGPPRSGSSNSIPPRSGPPNSIPPHAGPPHSIPPRSGAPGTNNRALSIMIAVAVVVVLAAIIAVVVAVSGDDSNASGGSSSGVVKSASTTSAVTSSPPPSTSATAATLWSEPYRQFTELIGSGPGAKGTGYRGATCTLGGPDTDVAGMLDQVTCSGLSNSSKVVFYVGRFSGKPAVDKYVASLVKQKYMKTYWTTSSMRRGLLLTSPSSIKYADVTSSICASPEFLVQFYAAEGSGIDEQSLENDYWKDSVFPNDTPAVCTS